jgi:polyhydroxyalkanoate synthase
MTIVDSPDGTDVAGALDLLLTDGALGPLRRFLPGLSAARFATRLAGSPGTTGRRGLDLIGELRQVAMGRSRLAPSKRDRRFADPAWTSNPLLHRVMQAHLAVSATAESLLADAGLDWRDDERIRFLVTNLLDAAAPSNNPLLNPLGWRAFLDTGGGNAMRGLKSLVSDLSAPPRVPAMVEPDAFEVGTTLAVTPGAVILRTPVFELIQYTPQTDEVSAVPLLMIPPVINKYYVMDIAPGRSLIEYLVQQGQQVFVMSWRNPDIRHRDWGFDTYGQAIVDALDATTRIAGTDNAHLMATCSGGILGAMVAAHLEKIGQLDRIASLALGVTVLDQARPGLTTAIVDEHLAKAAIAVSARRGYLDGRTLAEVFAWLRPNDLIWNYWVNNYLQGKPPPAFDVLFWNADTTRMTAALHRDFIELALSNGLTAPGRTAMLGTPVDLSTVDIDAYVIAGISDHICPWQSCYASTQLLGGKSRFVLSTAGHIASLVNPPTNPKASFQTNEENPPDPAQWLGSATTVSGTWWPDYARWLAERGGPHRAAPKELGGAGCTALDPAPGTYVFDR